MGKIIKLWNVGIKSQLTFRIRVKTLIPHNVLILSICHEFAVLISVNMELIVESNKKKLEKTTKFSNKKWQLQQGDRLYQKIYHNRIGQCKKAVPCI